MILAHEKDIQGVTIYQNFIDVDTYTFKLTVFCKYPMLQAFLLSAAYTLPHDCHR